METVVSPAPAVPGLDAASVAPSSVSAPTQVLAVASGGGHWVQLQRLRPAWDDCQVLYVTTLAGYEQAVLADAERRSQRKPDICVVPDANYSRKGRLFAQFAHMAWIVLRFRPQVVVTTGAAPGYFAIRLGRWIGARTIWIDSMANGEELSMAGRHVGRHASLWLTQWPHLATGADGPQFRGRVI